MSRIAYLPADHYDPPEHDCPLDHCDGTECLEAFAAARFDAMLERALANREAREQDDRDHHEKVGEW